MMQLALNLSLSTVILLIIAKLLPGFEIEHIREMVLACLLVGFLNFLLVPILAILQIPVNIVSILVFSFIFNMLLLNVATGLVDEFDNASWSAALLGAIFLSLVQVLSNVLTEDRRKLLG